VLKSEKGVQVARMGDRRGAYKVLVRKLEGKGPLERPGRRWENIKVYLPDMFWGRGLDLSASQHGAGGGGLLYTR
jgi:hypothetical protein